MTLNRILYLYHFIRIILLPLLLFIHLFLLMVRIRGIHGPVHHHDHHHAEEHNNHLAGEAVSLELGLDVGVAPIHRTVKEDNVQADYDLHSHDE